MKKNEVIIAKKNLLERILGAKNTRIFIIKGIPGSGKSSLLKSIYKKTKKYSFLYPLSDEDNDLRVFRDKLKSKLQKLYKKAKIFILIDDFHIIHKNREILNYLKNLFKIENIRFVLSSRKKINIEEKFSILKYEIITEKELWLNRKEIKKYYWKKFKKKIGNEDIEIIYNLTKGWPILINILTEVHYKKGINTVLNYYSKNSVGEYIEKEIFPLIPDRLKRKIGVLGILPESFNIEKVKKILNKKDKRDLILILKFLNQNTPFVNKRSKGIWEIHSLFLSFLKERGYTNEILKRINKNIYEELFLISALENYLFLKDFESLKNLVRKKSTEIERIISSDIIEKIFDESPDFLVNSKELKFLMGIYYKKTGELTKALNIFEELRKKGGELLPVSVYYSSKILMLMGKIKRARNILLPYLKKLKDDKRKIMMLSQISSCYIFSDDLNKAEKHIKRAIELSKKLKLGENTLLPLEVNLNVIKKLKGTLEESELYQMIKRSEEAGDRYNIIVLIYHLLDFLYKKGEIKKLYKNIEKGKKLSFMFDEYLHNAFLYYKNKVKIIDGKYDEAEKNLLKLIKKFREEGSFQYIGPLIQLLRIYILKGEYEKGFEMYERFREEIESSVAKDQRIILEFIGTFFRVMTGYRYEIPELEEILKSIKNKGYTFDYSWLLLYLIKAYEETGETEKFDYYLKKFNKIAKKNNFIVLLKERNRLFREREEKINVSMFGEFKILRNGRETPLKEIKGKKARKLLKFLFSKFNKFVENKELINLFWNESKTKKNLNSLYVAINEIRNFLKKNSLPFKILKKRNGYLMTGKEESIDTKRFLRLYNKSLSSFESKEKMNNVQKAITLYKGEFLECEPYEEVFISDRNFYREKYCELLLLKGKILIEEKKWKNAEDALKKLLEIDPVITEGYKLLAECYKNMDKKEEIIRLKKKLKREFYLHFREEPPDIF